MGKRIVHLSLICAVTVIFSIGCGGGGGSSNSGTAPAPTETVSGTVVKGYVKNATVFADKQTGAFAGNLELEADEVSTTSDANGDFALEVPGDYGDYVLVSIGGTMKDSTGNNVPAPPMTAPSGSENINPITTLITDNPELEATIGKENYDVDLADPAGVEPEILQLAMVVQTFLEVFTADANPLVSGTESKMDVVDHLADALENSLQDPGSKDLTDIIDAIDNGEAIKTAATTVLNDTTLIEDSDTLGGDEATRSANIDAIADAANTAAATVKITIENETVNGKVVETNILDEIESNVDTVQQTVDEKSFTVSIEMFEVTGLNAENQMIEPVSTDPLTYSSAAADTVAKLQFFMEAENEFDTEKSYTASLFVTVVDSASSRQATAEVTNVEVTVSPESTITLTTSTATRLVINGKNAAGEKVTADLSNRSTAGDTDIISITDNLLVLDCLALETKIQTELGEDHDLYDIGLPGDYGVSVSGSTGLPLAPYAENVTVE